MCAALESATAIRDNSVAAILIDLGVSASAYFAASSATNSDA
jgi:hypothetical protein